MCVMLRAHRVSNINLILLYYTEFGVSKLIQNLMLKIQSFCMQPMHSGYRNPYQFVSIFSVQQYYRHGGCGSCGYYIRLIKSGSYVLYEGCSLGNKGVKCSSPHGHYHKWQNKCQPCQWLSIPQLHKQREINNNYIKSCMPVKKEPIGQIQSKLALHRSTCAHFPLMWSVECRQEY